MNKVFPATESMMGKTNTLTVSPGAVFPKRNGSSLQAELVTLIYIFCRRVSYIVYRNERSCVNKAEIAQRTHQSTRSV